MNLSKAKIFTFYFALVVVAVSHFVSCTREKSSYIELTFWAMGAEGEHVQKLMPAFNAEYPNITISIQSIPWSAAHEKLLTAYAGNTMPDIWQLGNTWIPEFQAIDALAPLDSLIARSEIISPKNYFEGIWNTNIIAGVTFGIPWYVDTRLLFYRSDILAEAGYSHPPRTWDQWLDVSRRITQLSPDKEQYAIFLSTILDDWYVPVILIMNNGGRLLKENNCYAAFNDPKTVAALEYYLTFFRENLAIRTMSKVANIYQGFADNYFAMMITGPWNVNEIRKRHPELNGKWSTAMTPASVHQNSTAGGSSLVISKNTKHPVAAFKFIEFMSRAETQLEFFRITRDLPAVEKAWESPEMQSDQKIQAFYKQFKHVVPTPKIAEWEQIAVKLQEHLEQVIFNVRTLDETIPRLNADVDKILEKRRWLIENGLLQTSNVRSKTADDRREK